MTISTVPPQIQNALHPLNINSHTLTLTLLMSAAPAQKDKTSTIAHVAITNGPAATAIEPQKNKYKKFIKAIESNKTTPPEPLVMDTFEPPPMQANPILTTGTELAIYTLTDPSLTPSMTSSPDQTSSLLFEESPTPQTSPTPTGKKPTNTHTLLHAFNDHTMQVDQPPTNLSPTLQSQANEPNPTHHPL